MDMPKNVVAPGQSADLPTEDNTELVMLRERVTELDRLAAIGQLSAGILHEIKNPLNFVTNYARLSQNLVEEIEEMIAKLEVQTQIIDITDTLTILKSNLSRIRENGARAERIIQGMLAQTRADSSSFELTDLNTLLEEFTKLAYQGVRSGDREFVVSLSFELDSTVGNVLLAPYEFNRVVLNLVLNACYSVNERRKKQNDDYMPRILVSSQRKLSHVEIKIRDNGEGITDEVKSKLFTPFFTTKPVGKGTGLGLSLSRDIVTRLHKGTLTVDSETNNFTEFTIVLPLI